MYTLLPIPNIKIYLSDQLAKDVEVVKDRLNVSAPKTENECSSSHQPPQCRPMRRGLENRVNTRV